MNTGLRMALMSGKVKEGQTDERRYPERQEMRYPAPWPPYGNGAGMIYGGDEGGMPPEDRRYRDERGRYTRYPARRAEDDGGREMRYDNGGNATEMRRIGFERDPWEMGMHYEKNGENENTEQYKGNIIPMHKREKDGHGMPQPITRQKAQEWVGNMRSKDPSRPKGGKWSMEDVKPYAQRAGFPTEGEEFLIFYVIMNAMYTDYYEVAKKYNMQNNPQYFADLAKAWICDDDAEDDKAALYYEYIVKH